MAEYINREELIANLNKFAPEHLTPLIMNLIDKQPTADVGEVKHGHWKKSQFSGRSGFYSVRDVICSECGIYSTFLQHELRPDYYCPNCGAKMDGGNVE